jgi:ankyrin repeat protein
MSELQDKFFAAADHGDIEGVKAALEAGQDIEAVHELTGLSAIHFAIGRNLYELTKFLVAQGATIKPDRDGRWPSTIAELCEVDIRLLDFVVDEESKVEEAYESPQLAPG